MLHNVSLMLDMFAALITVIYLAKLLLDAFGLEIRESKKTLVQKAIVQKAIVQKAMVQGRASSQVSFGEA